MLTTTPIEFRLAQRADGTLVVLRARTPGDRDVLDTFVGELTESSRRSRFMSGMPAGLQLALARAEHAVVVGGAAVLLRGRGRRVVVHARDVQGLNPVAATEVAR